MDTLTQKLTVLIAVLELLVALLRLIDLLDLTPYGAATSSVQIRSMRICRSPLSLTLVSSWGFTRLSPSCDLNYLEYIILFLG